MEHTIQPGKAFGRFAIVAPVKVDYEPKEYGHHMIFNFGAIRTPIEVVGRSVEEAEGLMRAAIAREYVSDKEDKTDSELTELVAIE